MSKWFYLMLGTFIAVELLTRLIVLGAFDNESPDLSPKAAVIGLINFIALIIIIIAMYKLCV
jgi:hypothetical protein